MKIPLSGLSYCKTRFIRCLTKFSQKTFNQPCRLSSFRKVLGIESSCDDTGAAVVDENGQILGESLNSQSSLTVE